MTALSEVTQQPEVEFVNREFAEAEAKRAITLLNASDESKVEAWFALQAVADQIGPSSNVGVRGISWSRRRGTGEYVLSAKVADGYFRTATGAPGTLEEAREPERLARVTAKLEELIAAKGGRVCRDKRPNGTGRAIIEAVNASPEGKDWLRLTIIQYAEQKLLRMVRVADRYGREGVFPFACLAAHDSFISFDDRCDLVRAYPMANSAQAKAMSLRAGSPMITTPSTRPSATKVAQLAIRTGVSPGEARAILRAVMDGRSKTKLIRAVNEAVKMVGEDDSRGLRAA